MTRFAFVAIALVACSGSPPHTEPAPPPVVHVPSDPTPPIPVGEAPKKKDGPPLAWQAKGLGGGDSAPSVAAGRIFGMSNRGDDEIVWALSVQPVVKMPSVLNFLPAAVRPLMLTNERW